MKTLYPEIEPFDTFFLETGTQHQVYVEQCGNPHGIPVVFLHGGPCSGCKPDHRRYFNPEYYRVILLDQRGCGRSLPFGELTSNTTSDLLADLEAIRTQLQIDQWLLFGGSWGATLALLYAQAYPSHVSRMIIRGVFLARQQDFDWFLESGVNRIYPETWQDLIDCIEVEPEQKILDGLCASFDQADEVTLRRLTKCWMIWGAKTALGEFFNEESALEHITEKMIEQVRMELHYARNRYFLAENQIIEQSRCLADIPTVIVHGRQDLVCPLESGYRLAQALPAAEFIVLPTAGHVAQGEAMIDALVSATDRMAIALMEE